MNALALDRAAASWSTERVDKPGAPESLPSLPSVQTALEERLERMIAHQRARVLDEAQALDPRLTSEDVLQPDDVPVLRDSPPWNYEDGVLAGLLAAQVAMRAELRGFRNH